MKVLQLFMSVACAVTLSIGCSPAPSTAPAAQTPAPAVHDHDGHEHGDHNQAEANEIEAAMASLSAEDRAAATAQKVCPVSGEPLGSMGTPQKVDLNGNGVFVCCEGCTASLKSDPDKFLTKAAE